jgi:hypothetical protein
MKKKSMIENYDHKDRNIEYLLRKYENKQPDERWSNKTSYQYLREYRLREKLRISHNIMNRLHLNVSQRLRVEYLLAWLDFKSLCKRCSNETIITALSFYIKKETHPNIQISDYKVCMEHKLTEKLFSAIMVNLCSQLQKKSPLLNY